MGKKVKTGKARKDKFYQLAKETGYRARAAFKLLQLNRKYEFLQSSRVCIDLCAAPGSWLQVASQQMPVSSLIIGVDLVSIKPIPNVITFQEDITTAKCRQTLVKEMKTWKADVVLNDGAPNVGKNWLHDAFQQAQLTLKALKLASEFLRKGGWFVTKVFRSKDYHALLWVFKQLFKKVHATKPKASRNESAEIFIVCQGYIAPDVLDPKFTDPKYVFKDVASQEKTGLNLVHPEKIKKKAVGYTDDDYSLHHKLTMTEFLTSDNHLELLANCNELTFDDDAIASHKLTTTELKECCKDIKVLGKKELRNILNWRKKLITALKPPKEVQTSQPVAAEEEMEEEMDEETKMEEKLAELEETERKEMKRKRKKVMKEKRKLRDKMSLNMVIPGDQIEQTTDVATFDLEKIKHKHLLNTVEEEDMDAEGPESDSDDDDDDELPAKLRKQRMSYIRHDKDDPLLTEGGSDEYEDESDDDEMEFDDDDDDDEAGSDDDDDDEAGGKEKNPLLVDMQNKEKREKQKMDMWFSKDVFAGLEEDGDEDLEVEKAMEEYRKKGGVVTEKPKEEKKKQGTKRKKRLPKSMDSDSEDDEDNVLNTNDNVDDGDKEDSSENEDSDYDDTDMHDHLTEDQKAALNRATQKCGGFEVVPVNAPVKKVLRLDHVELAIGEELIKSSKRKREIVEMSYNRYMFDDEHLPEWFSKDEAHHCKRQLPVTKEQMALYKEQLKLINARPIKKIAEAKARKKQKMVKRLEKVRKKAESITDADVTDGEKWKQIKDMYRKAGLLTKKKESKTYVVAKKGMGKKVTRPSGVKGHFKVVDPRMKKDNMRVKKEGRQKGKKGKQRARKGRK